nr:MAG: ORF1 [TTV-like mini virus]
MPYYWRRPWRRRRRRIWRRRARKTFRRGYWRRRRRWVRHFKRKLRKITVKQWQPPKINRLKITGMYPLYEGTRHRLGNNNTQWIDTIAPEFYPGGGCFSINVFSLNSLYELHTKARNWWTQSNCKLPLIKYLGCKMTLYRSTNSDYIFVYATCGDMKATEALYQSTQPSVLALNKNKVIVTCDPNNSKKKPYKTVRIRPPAMMTNKWYFQQELAPIPLVMTVCSAASLQRYYLPSTSVSSTLGFYTLNTKFFQYHNFKHIPTSGYKPNDQFKALFTLPHGVTFKTAKYKDLVYLGNTKDCVVGIPLSQQPSGKEWNNWVTEYFTTSKYWGNPFHPWYFKNDSYPLLVTNQELSPTIVNKIQTNKDTLISTQTETLFTILSQETHIECRYNPQADTSHNAVFLQPIAIDDGKWHEPQQDTLTTKGLPLWILLQGWVDYHAKLKDVQRLMTDYCMCIVSDHITPELDYYVPLDWDFLEGKSPYQKQDGLRTIYDQQNWHPKLNFQVESIAQILNTGPGTVKLPPNISTEAHVKYQFYFKLGGCPPPMDDVCDPKKQPTYPTPGNILSSTLLQNPETPPQYYLSSFDQRRGYITEKAAKRLKTDWETKEHFLKPAGKTSVDIQIKTPETTSSEESEEEKDEEALQLKLQRHHRKQRKLRQRILELLKLAQKLE